MFNEIADPVRHSIFDILKKQMHIRIIYNLLHKVVIGSRVKYLYFSKTRQVEKNPSGRNWYPSLCYRGQ